MLICRKLGSIFPSVFLVAALLLNLSTRSAAEDRDAEAVQHFQAAQSAQNAGQLNLAAEEYLKVIQLRPDAAEAYASLGLVYHAQGKFSDSARALEKAGRLKPGLPGVNLYIGIDLARMEQPARAVPFLTKAVRQEPSSRLAHTSLSSALWNAGRIPDSLAQIRRTVLLFPSDPALLLDLDEAYRKAADQSIEKILTFANGTPMMHQLYGDIYRDEHSWQKGTGHYYRAIEMDPRWVGAHFGLAEVALRQDKLEDARQQYQSELQVDPKSYAAFARLGDVALREGKADEALKFLASATALSPYGAASTLGLPRPYPPHPVQVSVQATDGYRRSVDALASAAPSAARDLGLAMAYQRLGNLSAFAASWKNFQTSVPGPAPSGALQSATEEFHRENFTAASIGLERWIELHPDDVKAQYLLARAYQNLASDTLDQILILAPDSYAAHLLLAKSYANSGDNDKAVAEYKAVERMAPNLQGVHYSAGHLLLQEQRMPEAKSEFESELAINPNHAQANAELGTILLDQMQQAQAIEYLRRAVQLDPELWVTRRQLGKAYYLQKDYGEAKAALEQAIQHDPDGSAHYQLGLVYRATGQMEAANGQFELARKIKLESLAHTEDQFREQESLPR